MKRLTAAITLLALLSLGCENNVGPRQPHFPTFEARQPFPELVDLDEQATPTRSTLSGSSFERSIARELESGGEEGSTVTAQTQGVQTVSLSSVFVADVPLNFNEWQWSSDGPVTMLIHRKAGSAPDALVFIEAFSPAVERFPSFDVGRFQYTVDPGLSPNIVYPPLVLLAARWVSKAAGLPPMTTVLSLQKATTRTMGRGLGYSSTDGTFTGWRWVGHNDHKVALRLGRTTGTWASQPALDYTSRVVMGTLSQQVPALRELAKSVTEMTDAAARQPTRQAWMILGSAARSNTLGVHIAIICERQPVCPVAAELSALLSTLRPASDAQNVAVGSGGELKSFAASLGITMLNAQEAVSAPQMVTILETAMNEQLRQKQGAGNTPGVKIPGIPGMPALPINIPGLPGGGGGGGGTSPIPGLPGLPAMPTLDELPSP